MIDFRSENVAAAAVDSPSKTLASPKFSDPIASTNLKPLWSGFGHGLHTELRCNTESRAQACDGDGKQAINAL